MKLFTCRHCGQLLYLENNRCEKCHYPLGFQAEKLALEPLVATPGAPTEGAVHLYGAPPKAPGYTYCANHGYHACNWLVPLGSPTPFCAACALNRTIPDLSQPEYLGRWQRLEVAKHRLVFSLLRLGLPVVSKHVAPKTGLWFDFKADEGPEPGEKILTGHDNGLITINIAEADDIEREMARKSMDELYRTLLGHFRHEVGHYYWDRLIDHTPFLKECRQLFGDDRQDYAKALKKHYAQGPPPDWMATHISAYATTHPWEDWAETWAHYLHIMDTLETAHAYGLRVAPRGVDPDQHLRATIPDPYLEVDFEPIMAAWLPLTFAMNSLNRSMGQPDPYPFVIGPAVVPKLAFIHKVCRAAKPA
ncbi:putative zinc-binding metallopeptidase [Hymenobacter caeli]|uniref:Zinc-ribbon domain-containing protein n=1 Tax=Hymenobacter caeli TaxID=2735894 RepID=A0ABX2FM25_9BACT|nr:putative zinc-binding metallopeptidase [Hymenobacter caeli]NRT18179.1 hypothetical protein [Hymenobacter caeli]